MVAYIHRSLLIAILSIGDVVKRTFREATQFNMRLVDKHSQLRDKRIIVRKGGITVYMLKMWSTVDRLLCKLSINLRNFIVERVIGV